jgi:hypothetical protein
MEAIKQTLNDGIFAVSITAVAVLFLTGATLLLLSFDGKRFVIKTEEVFKVVGTSSEYSCVVSEVDSDLLIKCLKIK